MGIYHIGNASAASGSATLVVTVGTGLTGPTYQAPGAGDFVWLECGNSGSNAISSVVDSHGQSYPVAVVNGAGTQRAGTAAAIPAAALIAGDTYTITWAGTTGSKFAIVKGCDGVSSATVDKSNGQTGTSAAPTSGTSGTLSQPAELAAGAIQNASAGGTPSGLSFGTGLTQNVSGSAFLTAFDTLTASTGALSASGTITSAAYGAVIATFPLTAPSITTNTLPGGTVGTAYSQQLAKSGGTSGFTWADSSGGLAGSGLVCGTGGLVHGTTPVAGSYTFTAQLTDGAGQVTTKSLTVAISGGGGLAITSTPPATGTTGTPYASGNFAAINGTGPYSFSLAGGTLPPGCTWSGSGGGGAPFAGVTMNDTGYANINADYDWWNGHIYQAGYKKIYTINVGSFAIPATLSAAADDVRSAVAKGNAIYACYKPTAVGTTNDPTWPGGANKPAQGNASTPGTIQGDLHLLIQSVTAFQNIGATVAGIVLYQEADGHKRQDIDGIPDRATQIPYLNYQYYGPLKAAFPSIPVIVCHVGWVQNTDSPSRSDMLPFPTQVTSPRQAAVTAGTGGSFTAGTYYWRIAATDGWGRVYASNEVSLAISGTQSAALSWVNPGSGANASSDAVKAAYTQIQVFRGTTPGGENRLVTTLAAGATSFTDTGAAGSAQTLVPSVYADGMGVDLYGDGFDAQTAKSKGRYVYSDNPNTSPGYADIADWNGLAFGWMESGNTVGGAPTLQTVINYLQGNPSDPNSTPSSLKNSVQAVSAARQAAGKPHIAYMWYENPKGTGGNQINDASDPRIPPLKAIAGALTTGGTASWSGTPTLAGAYTYQVAVRDSASPPNTAVQSYTVTISGAAAPLTIPPQTLPDGQAGQPYAAVLNSDGGTPPVSWALTKNTLPTGVTVDSTGILGGTATAQGTFTPRFTVTDSAGKSASITLTINITPAVAPPQPPGISLPPVKPWHFLIATPQPDGSYLAEVAQAQSRTLTLRAGGGNYSEAAVNLAGLDPVAPFIAELQTDMQVLLGDEVLFCGRIGATADVLDASAYRLTPTASDYREVFRRRSFAYGGGPPFNADIADIAWDIIRPGSFTAADGQPWTGVQGYPGGALGVTRGAGKDGLGKTVTINYIHQQFAGIEIDNLCGAAYDWDISPYGPADLRLDMWPGARGIDRGVVLEYGGGLVSSITRSVDPSAYANDVFVTGQHNSAQTTVGSGSNGGTITNIASWGSPGAGVLDVADASQLTWAGEVWVHASVTDAIVSYTGKSGSTLTGCQCESGAGTVSTGNTVSQWGPLGVQLDAPDIASAAQGRWSQVISTSHTVAGPLADAAAFLLAASQVITPSYTVVLYPGAWGGPEHIGLGDTVTIRIQAGRLTVNDSLTVMEMAFDVNSDNVETLTLTIGRIPFREHQTIKRMLRRLRNLESQ